MNHKTPNGDGIAPDAAVVGDVDGFEGDDELIAFGEVVSGDDGVSAHVAASLLKVEIGGVVFAGGGERTDGEGWHVAEGGGNLIGQGEAEKVGVVIGADVLEG